MDLGEFSEIFNVVGVVSIVRTYNQFEYLNLRSHEFLTA